MSTISASTTSTTAFKITTDTTGALVFQTGSSPTTALTLDTSQNATLVGNIRLNNGTADGAQLSLASSGYSDWNIDNYSGNFRWYYNATEYMRLDSSGNLGLGVTSSAWATNFKAIDINGSSGGGAVFSASNVPYAGVITNAYFGSGGGVYKQNGFAGYYLQDMQTSTGGKHIWATAPSGTAGNAISFTQAMTLDASGNLGLGDTSPSTSLSGSVRGITIKSTADSQLRLFNNTSGSTATDGLLMSINNALDGYFWNYENANIYFGTNNTVRASVTSAGNFSLAGGNLVLAAGYGIDFSANSHAGGMQTELLNDYEEGWWTPVLSMGSNSASPTSTNYRGRYIKIGNWVTFNMYVRFNTTGFSGAGSCQVSLPFTNGASNNEQFGSFDISYVSDIFTGIPSGSFVGGYIISGASSLVLTFSSPNGAETQISNAYLQKTASVGIMISGSYSTINSP